MCSSEEKFGGKTSLEDAARFPLPPHDDGEDGNEQQARRCLT
jgi:hypothetical protein